MAISVHICQSLFLPAVLFLYFLNPSLSESICQIVEGIGEAGGHFCILLELLDPLLPQSFLVLGHLELDLSNGVLVSLSCCQLGLQIPFSDLILGLVI